MNSNTRSRTVLMAFGLLFCASGAFAQSETDTRWLILKTEPEDTPIELIGSLRIDADGNMEATPVDPEACRIEGDADPETCEDLDVLVGPSTFRGNNNQTSVTVQEGTAVAFTWNSRGAWSCDGAGTLPGWNTRFNLAPRSTDATPSQRTVATAGLASETAYQATLSCTNGPVTVNESVSVTINESDSQLPEACDSADRLPPAGWTRLSTGTMSCHWSSQGGWNSSSDCRTWDMLFPSNFMGSSGTTRRLGLRSSNARDYIAIQFDTNGLSPTATGAINVNHITALTSRRKLLTISRCPGDFNRDAIMAETGCYMESLVQNFNWGGTATTQTCKLDSNEVYYFNIIYTNSPVGTPTQDIEVNADCAAVGTVCGNLYNPVN